MAAPTAPTLVSLTTEGLKRAGYNSPGSDQLTRAQDEWMEEIKNDIWVLGKRLKPLMATHVEILDGGKSRYDFPSGFSSIYTAQVLYGDEVDDVGGGAAATITLDSNDEDMGEEELEGREVVVYSGTAKAEVSQITSYNESTYVAAVSPAWATQPVGDETYFIVDEVFPLELKNVDHFDEISVPHDPGTPECLYQVGDDTHYGHYQLYPFPHEDYYYAVRIKYFVNLLTLDLASDRMSTLYQRWRNLWIQGVKARQLSDDDDVRGPLEMQKYYSMVRDIANLETYGRNVRASYTSVRA